jgi:hypothetical protein
MSNKSDKRKQEELERQAAADRAARDRAMTVAAAPTPLESAYDKERLDWMDQTSGKAGPLDISTLKGMGPSLGLYNAASQRQQGERMGLGALRLGEQGSNPMLGQLLRSQQEDERQQAAAGGLENAYRMKDAEMRGSIMPLLGLQQNRTMGLAGMTSGNAANATGQWASFRPAPSFWQQLLMAGVSGASQVGSAMAGAPRPR